MINVAKHLDIPQGRPDNGHLVTVLRCADVVLGYFKSVRDTQWVWTNDSRDHVHVDDMRRYLSLAVIVAKRLREYRELGM